MMRMAQRASGNPAEALRCVGTRKRMYSPTASGGIVVWDESAASAGEARLERLRRETQQDVARREPLCRPGRAPLDRHCTAAR